MKNCIIAIITGSLLLLSHIGVAQVITEKLDKAKEIFEEGRIQESLDLLEEIEKSEKLSKDQKVLLYRQRTICYIFMDKDNVFLKNPEQPSDSTSSIEMAQDSYLQLLKENNVYEVEPTDLIDYFRFSKKFSSKPILMLNPNLGFNTSFVDVLEYYGTSNLDITDTSYYNLMNRSPYGNVYTNFSFGLDVGWYFYNNFSLTIGGFYTQRSYKYNENLWFGTDNSTTQPNNDGSFNLKFQEKQRWIDIALRLKYDIGESKEIIPYFYGGITYHRLQATDFADVQRSFTENLSIDGIDILDARWRNNYSVVGGVGLRWKSFDKHYFTINAEYGRMIEPLNNINKKYTSAAASTWNYVFGYVDNDIRLNNVSFMVGFAYTFYNPKMIKTSHDK